MYTAVSVVLNLFVSPLPLYTTRSQIRLSPAVIRPFETLLKSAEFISHAPGSEAIASFENPGAGATFVNVVFAVLGVETVLFTFPSTITSFTVLTTVSLSLGAIFSSCDASLSEISPVYVIYSLELPLLRFELQVNVIVSSFVDSSYSALISARL